MQTGFDLTDDGTVNDAQVDFMRKTVCILKILAEEALSTAERFVKTCGRTIITGNDMYYALMYEAHEFFQKDFDARFYEELEREKQHTYLTDEESEDDEGEGEEDSLEENQENDESEMQEKQHEAYTLECVIPQDSGFHSKVLKYAAEWRDWFPEDPVHKMIKDAIDKTKRTESC